MRVIDVSISKIRKNVDNDGVPFYTRDYIFVNIDGERVELTAYSETKKTLK